MVCPMKLQGIKESPPKGIKAYVMTTMGGDDLNHGKLTYCLINYYNYLNIY